MAVAVFDADVVIAFLNREDASHTRAVEVLTGSLASGTRRLISAVNYSEVLIGPLTSGGPEAAGTVGAMFSRLGIEVIEVDMALAERAAAVRARTMLKLPDAYALATAIHAEHRGHADVRLESFDKRVVGAFEELHGQ